MSTPEVMGCALARLVSPGTVVRICEPLGPRTTLRIGGPADCLVEPTSEADLARVVKFCESGNLPWMVLGRGSNLLVLDGGFRGVVISLQHEAFQRIRVTGDCLECGAGARLRDVARAAREAGLGGLEFLEGIPGSVGGALRMNAGAMGSWTFDLVKVLRLMTRRGEVREVERSALRVEYRACADLRDAVALGAVWQGSYADRETIEERRWLHSTRRGATLRAAPSAGCIFKNPPGTPAGRLIDELGLKGMRVGGAVVSEVHGNFVVNDGAATARDVLELISQVRERVRMERGIELDTEVEIVGQAPAVEASNC